MAAENVVGGDGADGAIHHQNQIMMHSCEIEITFPTSLQAKQAMEVLQVDQEPTTRVTKSFRLSTTATATTTATTDGTVTMIV